MTTSTIERLTVTMPRRSVLTQQPDIVAPLKPECGPRR
jgi:hypothetical protein